MISEALETNNTLVDLDLRGDNREKKSESFPCSLSR